MTKSIKDISQDVTGTKDNNKTLLNLNDNLLRILNDVGILKSFFLSLFPKITNSEHTNLFKLIKDPDSKRTIDHWINKSIPVTLYNILLPHRDTDKQLELRGNLLKIINNKKYQVDLANLPDKKLMFEFAKEMYFD